MHLKSDWKINVICLSCACVCVCVVFYVIDVVDIAIQLRGVQELLLAPYKYQTEYHMENVNSTKTELSYALFTSPNISQYCMLIVYFYLEKDILGIELLEKMLRV